MKNLNLIAGLVVLLSFIPVRGAPPATRPAAPPAVGDQAADFSLNTLDGKKVQLSELQKVGPVVVIQLRGWVGYQCPYCTRQVGDFIAHAADLRKAGAQVVLIYPGPADQLNQHASDFIAGQGLPADFLLVTDPGLSFVNSWGLRWNKPHETAYPATFVIDQSGTVQFAHVSHGHGGRATSKQVLEAMPARR